MRPIYLDYNATTPIDPAVLRAMLPFLAGSDNAPLGHFGNPSSTHAFGTTAHKAVLQARQQVADLIGARPEEIIFTSGGSEASNHALKGAVLGLLRGFWGRWARRAHLVISSVEHPATTEPAQFLQRLGCKLTVVPVDGQGLVDPDAVGRAIRNGATLVSIMHSNNEVGTLMPVKEIAALTRPRGVLLHTDAAQSLGKVPLDVNDLGVDLLTIAGHKLYAPKGVGVLYVRNGVRLENFIHGAGQETGRRAGTENVPYVVGLGQACALAKNGLAEAGPLLARTYAIGSGNIFRPVWVSASS